VFLRCASTGTESYLANGLICDAGKIVAKAVVEYGWFDASTLKNLTELKAKRP